MAQPVLEPPAARVPPVPRAVRQWGRAAVCASVGVLVLVLSLAGCMSSSRTDTDYRNKVANSAEVVRSSIETARLLVRAAKNGKSPGPYTSRTLSQLESAVDSVVTQFGSVQPPTQEASQLRDDVISLLDEVQSALSQLRIAARQGLLQDLPRMAEPLPGLSERLRRFQELVPT
ncbi:hypothetical protein J7E88_18700 [Streptomyces sp. ISL-10]|uniref:hypothetical protein n=1 Tax=Streptomyces sp. ISL-10 TaxID=2819172 RepID=UPI001BEC5F67|nr:hypothetical protein [Streptomyces sp. ISL-10]MBT2367279.1 hypothetical protein [Streptomyces sp. ISL-10]